MDDKNKQCCLTLDEMEITPSVEYDPSSKQVLGDVTLPGHSGRANHALVFMLGGIADRWKQVVAYHFTGRSIKGDALAQMVTNIISTAHSIGLRVVALTSDMGPSNQAMWRSLGILCSRDNITSYVIHPDLDTRVHVLADVPHLVKNLRSALVTHKVFYLSDHVCAKHKLTSNAVLLSHVMDLLECQSEEDLKLAPNLSAATVSSASHFSKMSVGNAMHLFSKSVSAALQYLVQKQSRPEEFLTTSWFIGCVDEWFNLMTSRHVVVALSKQNMEAYKAARSTLESFMENIASIQIGEKPVWKPVQTGILLSTQSVLHLCDDLLDKQQFLLTARLSQDCVENLFSCVRSRNPVPTARECKYALKTIAVAQYLKSLKTSNYQEDDRQFLGDLLPPVIIPPVPEVDTLLPDMHILASCATISPNEKNALYYLAGYCLQSLKKLQQVCGACFNSALIMSAAPHACSTYLKNKNFKDGALCEVSDDVFDMFERWEGVVCSMESLIMSPNIANTLFEKCTQSSCDAPRILLCHDIVNKLARKFVNARLHFLCKKQRVLPSNAAIPLGSRSAAMRHLVKKL